MAMLVYEAAKCQGQNEGTLCGELTTETVKNITDSDVTITTEEVLCKLLCDCVYLTLQDEFIKSISLNSKFSS